jgi:hypothetical protein
MGHDAQGWGRDMARRNAAWGGRTARCAASEASRELASQCRDGGESVDGAGPLAACIGQGPGHPDGHVRTDVLSRALAFFNVSLRPKL